MTHSTTNHDFSFLPVQLELKSGRISLAEAIRDIHAILANEKLGRLTAASIGGSIPKERFFNREITDTNAGVLMWYCYNDDHTKPFPQFFLAMQMTNLSEVEHNVVLAQKLVAPSSVFRYNGNLNEDGVVGYLSGTGTQLIATDLATGIKNSDVAALNQRFEAMQKDAAGNSFNIRTWAYFQNNKNTAEDKEGLLTRLVNQPNAVHIHYYFGYDEHSTGKNRIRIILIAADANHKNLPDLVVQRSIPPAIIR